MERKEKKRKKKKAGKPEGISVMVLKYAKNPRLP